MRMRARALVAVAFAAAAGAAGASTSGCRPAPEDTTPEGAARAFVERLEASSVAPRALDGAYALLSRRTRDALEAKAERASRAQGRRFRAPEMIAEGFLGLAFRPTSWRATVHGDEADVAARGPDPTREAHVRCVREPEGWRVELELAP